MSKVIWGINPVLEALKSRPHSLEEILIAKGQIKGKLHRIVELAQKNNVPFKLQSRFNPAKVPKGATTQGVVAYLRTFDYVELPELLKRALHKGDLPLVVVADGITDPQNLGALIRSAEAAGAHGLIIPKHRSADVTGTVIKASSGAVFHLAICRVNNIVQALEFLKKEGLWVIGLAGESPNLLYEVDLKVPLALVVGSEGKGIRPLVRKTCDLLLAIPMPGRMESLNASVAGSVALFEVLRQRRYSH